MDSFSSFLFLLSIVFTLTHYQTVEKLHRRETGSTKVREIHGWALLKKTSFLDQFAYFSLGVKVGLLSESRKNLSLLPNPGRLLFSHK